jgi:hypothetical protein
VDGVIAANSEYELAARGGARGDALREATDAAKAFDMCYNKVR